MSARDIKTESELRAMHPEDAKEWRDLWATVQFQSAAIVRPDDPPGRFYFRSSADRAEFVEVFRALDATVVTGEEEITCAT